MKICPSCGSSVRDAAESCPSCEFDFEEGSSATMRGVPPVESEETSEESQEDQDADDASRQTAFGMPTADSRPDRVPDVSDSQPEPTAEPGEPDQAKQEGGTTSIPRDELQGILGDDASTPQEESQQQTDPGEATTSIERDSLDELVGGLDESSGLDASGTRTSEGTEGTEGRSDERSANQSAVPTMHERETKESDAVNSESDETSTAERASTEFGMPAAEVESSEETSAEQPSGPAPQLSEESLSDDSMEPSDSGQSQGPSKTHLGMSGVSADRQGADTDPEADRVQESPGDTQPETTDSEAEPFNIKGFQETGDSQAADIGDGETDGSEPSDVRDERPASEESEEELWSATIEDEAETGDEASRREDERETLDRDLKDTSPPSAASLFEESSESSRQSQDDSTFHFEEGAGGAAEPNEPEPESGPQSGQGSDGADSSPSGEGSDEREPGSAAAQASGIIRPKHRDRGSSEGEGSGLIGGGTYMVKGDGEGLEEESDLEEVEGEGIDWDEFDHEGFGNAESTPQTEDPTTAEHEVDGPASSPEPASAAPDDSGERVEQEPTDTASRSADEPTDQAESTEDSVPEAQAVQTPGSPDASATDSGSVETPSAQPERRRHSEVHEPTPKPVAETARKAEPRGRRGGADQTDLDQTLVEIGQSMFGTVAGVLLIVFGAMRLVSPGSPFEIATLVSGFGGFTVIAAPFLPVSLNARSLLLSAVGLVVLVVVPVFGIEGGFQARHVFGVLGGALTLVAGLFPTVVRMLESLDDDAQ